MKPPLDDMTTHISASSICNIFRILKSFWLSYVIENCNHKVYTTKNIIGHIVCVLECILSKYFGIMDIEENIRALILCVVCFLLLCCICCISCFCYIWCICCICCICFFVIFIVIVVIAVSVVVMSLILPQTTVLLHFHY